MKHFSYALSVSIIACFTSMVFAVGMDKSTRLHIDAGILGIADGVDVPAHVGLEYRGDPSASHQLIPAIGMSIAESGASFIYAGWRRDFYFHRLILTPGIDIGLFNNTPELALGHEIEFRTTLGLAYVTHHRYRVGLAVFHISNGGLSSQNPGTEAIVLSFSIPLGR